jgi:hypothetical protein
MGSFYSSCSISHMTLNNQKTSVLLLIPGWGTNIHDHRGMIVSNEGSQAFYSPFGFPIHGEYYDYGYLENIKEDVNTKMLEEFFNMNISEIIQHIGRPDYLPENIKNKELYNSLSMTYFRTEVLEYLERGWNEINLDSTYEYSQGYRMNKFFNNLFNQDPNIKRRDELLNKSSELTETEKEELREILILSMKFDLMDSSLNYIRLGESKNMFNILPIDDKFKEHILRQSTFLTTFGFELRRTLLPSDYGSQDTNFSVIYELNEFVNDLLFEDMKNENDYESIEEYESIIKKHQRNKNLRDIGI